MKPYIYRMTRPLDWQRANPNVVAIPSILRSKESWYDQYHKTFWSNWQNQIFNLNTASPFGLLVWSFILDVPAQAFLLFPGDIFWAFGEKRQNYLNIPTPGGGGSQEGGNFIGGTDDTILTPVEAKKALRLKYYSLITNGTIPMINRALLAIFGRHADGFANAWMMDNYDMTVTYFHRDYWSPAFTAAIMEFDMIPKIAGVSYTIESV